MKFFNQQMITLNRNHYTITDCPTLAQRIRLIAKILAVVVLALWAGVEHVVYVAHQWVNRSIESVGVWFVTAIFTPKCLAVGA